MVLFWRASRTSSKNFIKKNVKMNTFRTCGWVVLLFIAIMLTNDGMCKDVLTHDLARCWHNTNKQKTAGSIYFICFKDTEINITFWTPTGGLDYSEENWRLKNETEFVVDEDVCEFNLRSELLHIKKCKVSGIFSKD